MSTVHEKYFTVEQANKTLPLVKVIVQDIVDLFADVVERRDRLRAIRERRGNKAPPNDPFEEEILEMERLLECDLERLQEFADELAKLGAELKDPSIGLIDFRGQKDGREVYLCWKLGEQKIDFWHELDAGFSGRQPVELEAGFRSELN